MKPRDRTSITTASWVIRDPAARPRSTILRDQFGRQVVGDVPAEILEHLGRGAPAGAGQPGDQHDVDTRFEVAARLAPALAGIPTQFLVHPLLVIPIPCSDHCR